MENENNILESIDIVGLKGFGVTMLIAIATKLCKEILIVTNNMSQSMLQNTYHLIYSQIPAEAIDIQSIVNAIYFNSLSNSQQVTDSAIMTLTLLEYLSYFVGFTILLVKIFRLFHRIYYENYGYY